NGQKITTWPAADTYLQLTYQGELKAVYAYQAAEHHWQSRYVFTNE
ncbi:MAG TPA: tRNA pseudouridine(55) synthase TruB, partial [Leuconostoc lactis]|nr:tRNA pseudouridine(55) synthase TruB [Leuconostoc lactis]